jgi:hypothetical protein
MVDTEDFVKGTEPGSVCPLHPSLSFMDRLAGLFGGGRPDVPQPPEQSGLPPARTGKTGVSEPQAPARDGSVDRTTDPTVEEAPKKRGFWARVFGRGGNKSDKR